MTKVMRQKRAILKAMEAFAWSEEAFEKLQWCCVKQTVGSGPDSIAHAGFRRYTQDLVDDSGTDRFRGLA